MLFAITQRISNGLLHLRIRNFALARRFFRHQFQNVIAVVKLDDRADFADLESDHRSLQLGIALVEGRLGNKTQVAARRGRGGILGIIHGQLRKIGAVAKLLQERGGLAASFHVRRGVIILAIVKLRIFLRRNHNLRQAVLRFRHVELGAVLIVEIGNVLIADGDLGHHFTIDQLLHGKLAPDIVF